MKQIKMLLCCVIISVLLCSCQSQVWYVDQSNFDYSPSVDKNNVEFSKESRNYAVNLPRTVTQACEGIDIQIDFFQEQYRIGEFIQVRVTMVNHSGKDIVYDRATAPGTFTRGERGNRRTLRYSWALADPEFTYGQDSSELREWKQDAKVVVERIYLTDPEFFLSNSEAVFRFQCATYGLIGESYEKDSGNGHLLLTFDIPCEVVSLADENN